MMTNSPEPGLPGPPAREEKPPSALATAIRRMLLAKEIKTLFGPESVQPEEDSLVILCLVRDGLPYVEEFVKHYRSLGAQHIVFLDNGSTDGTIEAVRSLVGGVNRSDDITVLSSNLPYREYKYLMKQYLHERFGMGRWSLYVDVDEFFDFPYSEALEVGDFLGYLTQNGYTAVTCQMLDMFPERLVAGDKKRDDFLREHRFYDLSDLFRAKPGMLREWNNEITNPLVERFSGGIRKTLFDIRPNLTKYPLVFMDGKVMPAFGSSHRVSEAKIADISCVLYHYKFLQGFHDQARRAVREGNYYAASKEYRKYLEVLDSGPEIVFKQETSRFLAATDDLIEENFIIVSSAYIALAERLSKPDKARSEERAAHLLKQQQFAAGLTAKRQKAQDMREERERRHSTDLASSHILNERSIQDNFSDKVRPLFVGGCQRSGTTALVEYLNVHAEIALCYERYKRTSKDDITPEKFTFERILDYRPGETNKPWNLGSYIERHRQMLETKRAESLCWIGDKNPNFVANMPVLLKNNPGARFIMLYRPVEEVVESWQSRAADAADYWNPSDGFEKGVQFWNRAMYSLREFAESEHNDRLLILDYQGFFSEPERSVPLLSRFLGVEFSNEDLKTWREKSAAFDSDRRRKSPLTEEQLSYIEAHADRASESYVKARILAQQKDNSVCAAGRDPAASIEAQAFAAARRYGTLFEAAQDRIAYYAARSENLERQLEAVRSSRPWRTALFLARIRSRISTATKRLRR